jgi:aminomethyltransferase
MGYVDAQFAGDGTQLAILVRGVERRAVIAPLPFVAHRYKRKSGD